MKRTFLVVFVTLICITIGSLLFIKMNNDHKECDTKTVYTKDSDGNNIATKEHICKEKYNF